MIEALDRNWESVIGQEHLTNNLKNALKFQKISHAYIIQGEKSSGKKMVADVFARALLCESEGSKPCNECRSCKQAMNKNHPDVIYIEHEKPNVISVDNVRMQINNDIAIKPYSSAYKIYIMDEAEKMNIQAQNALLKTLEEPPEYAVIFLLTTNIDILLPTILSRCVTLNIKPVASDLIKKHLMEKVEIPDYRASVCASFARGNVGRAIELATDEAFDALKSEALAVLKSISDMEVNQMVAAVKKISEEKLDVGDYLDLCTVWYRDVLLYKSCKNVQHIIFREDISDIQRVAEDNSYEQLEQKIKSVDHARSRLKANVNFDLTMELLFMELKGA
ncbi:MAG: DNA polymerase III subunit delta' [Lachnospiraceae bacterium]|nr:DNA polymerase III subunit delta' [Lachnospiraceae bacterium]